MRRGDVDYCYSFSDELQQEWNWSEKYATQAEILDYLNWVADKLDLRRDITFGNARQLGGSRRGHPAVDGEHRRREVVEARFVIMATGALSAAMTPGHPGLDTFGGEVYHTAHWPQVGVDFTGKRVAVIGTGSSGIQSIPLIAEQAAQLLRLSAHPEFQRARGQPATGRR